MSLLCLCRVSVCVHMYIHMIVMYNNVLCFTLFCCFLCLFEIEGARLPLSMLEGGNLWFPLTLMGGTCRLRLQRFARSYASRMRMCFAHEACVDTLRVSSMSMCEAHAFVLFFRCCYMRVICRVIWGVPPLTLGSSGLTNPTNLILYPRARLYMVRLVS